MSDKALKLSQLSAIKGYVDQRDNTKQDTLVSGTNIKTVNNTTLLGSGNISIPKGDTGNSGVYVGSTTPTDPLQNVWINIDESITQYLSNATVVSSVLTITKSDGTTVIFQGGGDESTSNKVTSISSASTDIQYPSAKCVYDLIGDIESTLNTIRGV